MKTPVPVSGHNTCRPPAPLHQSRHAVLRGSSGLKQGFSSEKRPTLGFSQVLAGNYDQLSDLWSCGVIMYAGGPNGIDNAKLRNLFAFPRLQTNRRCCCVATHPSSATPTPRSWPRPPHLFSLWSGGWDGMAAFFVWSNVTRYAWATSTSTRRIGRTSQKTPRP